MRKTTLVKYVLIVGSLIAWGAFCWIKIPQYQAENRAKDVKLRIQIQQEHDRNYVDIIDSEDNMHSVPRSEYEEAHKEDIYIQQYFNQNISIMNVPSTETKTEESTEEESTETKAAETKAEESKAEEYTEEESYMEYDKATLELLARLCESEAGIESYQCKVYVASVVLNRCLSEDHPDTIKEVIWERVGGTPQFSVTIKYNGTCMLEKVEPSKDSFKAARHVLDHGPQLPEDVTVFYSNSCKGNWVATRETYITIDHTTFAYYWRKE